MRTINTDIQLTLGSVFTTGIVPSHDMKQGSIRSILLSNKVVTPFYRFISQQISKSKNSFLLLNVMVIVPPIACTYLHLTQTQQTFPYSEELSMCSHQAPKNPVHISHLIYLIMTFKKSSDIITAN